MDFELKDHILKYVWSFAADGGSKERIALILAVEKMFPSVVTIFRDATHALRMSVQKVHCAWMNYLARSGKSCSINDTLWSETS